MLERLHFVIGDDDNNNNNKPTIYRVDQKTKPL